MPSRDGPTRRRLLAAGVAAAGALAGCQTGDEETTTVTPAAVPSGAVDPGRLVVRYDDAGRRTPTARAMAGTIGAFTDRRDAVEVRTGPRTDRAPGPDDSLVAYGRLGAAVVDRAERGDLTEVEDRWDAVATQMPEGLFQTSYLGGRLVAVPQALTRLNTLYYNPSVLDSAGVDPEAYPTVSDLTTAPGPLDDAVETLFSAPMRSAGDRLALWESTLSSRLVSQRQFEQLRAGGAGSNRLTLRRTMRDYGAALSALPDDADALSPAALLDGVLDGRVGFARLSSRAALGLIGREDATYGEDWALMPMFNSPWATVLDVEGFVVPVATAELDRPRSFVRFATGADTQRRFAAASGTVPARRDAAEAVAHHPSYESVAAHYREATVYAPSMATGVTVRGPVRTRLHDALVAFADHGSVDTAVDGVVDALNGVSML